MAEYGVFMCGELISVQWNLKKKYYICYHGQSSYDY